MEKSLWPQAEQGEGIAWAKARKHENAGTCKLAWPQSKVAVGG